MKVRFDHAEYTTDRIAKSVERILEATQLCSMATVSEGNVSHINTAYFCFDDRLDIYFVSQLSSVHIRNIATNPSMAVSIFDTHQPWDDWKTGLQFFGTVRSTDKHEFKHGSELYKKRFPDSKKWLHSLGQSVASSVVPPFYLFTPARVKVLDEEDFGEETFVEAAIKRDKE